MDIGIGLGSAIAIYFVIWWVTFFAVLPIGYRAVSAPDELVKGQEAGAPRTHKLKLKVLVTTVVAFIVFGLYVAVLNSGLTLDDIPLPSPPGT